MPTWQRNNPNDVLTKEKFALLLEKCIENGITVEPIKNGLACGIYPWNKDGIDFSKCLVKSRSLGEEKCANNCNIYIIIVLRCQANYCTYMHTFIFLFLFQKESYLIIFYKL